LGEGEDPWEGIPSSRLREIPGPRIYLVKGEPIKGLMGAFLVEKIKAITDSLLGLIHHLARPQIRLLIFETPQEPFDEHVVDPAALAVRADPDLGLLEPAGDDCAGEPSPLVGVEDLRDAMAVQGL
jgi:hypothetical protein